MELRLPAPCLVVLVGPSAAGKSTWATRHFRDNEIVSSDALRAAVGIDETDRRAGTVAFELVNRIIEERIGRGLTTVVDTLGYDPDLRHRWIETAHASGIPAYAIVFATPGAVCEERNEARETPIPKTVLRKQISRMPTVVEALGDDDFDGIHEEQPVAAVPPTMAAESPTPETQSGPSDGLSYGLLVSRFDWPGDAVDRAGQLASIAERAEVAGFSDLWVMDHFQQIPGVGRKWEEMPEAYTTLAYLAGISRTIRLGTLVTGVTYRNPALLGKMVATLDVVSGGRAICGIGAAWYGPEHRAYGWDFPPVADRYAQLEDALQLLPLLWGKGSPSFEGKTIAASELICYPRPIQEHIPILIGGSGRRKTLRLVAQYADLCNLFGEPDEIADLVGDLREHCADVERDPADITVTNLTPTLVAPNRGDLTKRVDRLRPRDVTAEHYGKLTNAGTVDDHVRRFERFSTAGVQHPIVALPDVAIEGSIETFAHVIAQTAGS